MAVRDIEGEIPWRSQVIGTAEWTGVALAGRARAGRGLGSATHVELQGAETVERGGRSRIDSPAEGPQPRGAPGLGHEREPLPRSTAAPLRALVPGYIGARSVKWLRRVRLLDGPSENHFQAVGYRLHPPQADPDTADPADGMPLGELGVNPAILPPRDGARWRPAPVEVRGYAITGGDSQRGARGRVHRRGPTGRPPSWTGTRAGGRGGCGAPRCRCPPGSRSSWPAPWTRRPTPSRRRRAAVELPGLRQQCLAARAVSAR